MVSSYTTPHPVILISHPDIQPLYFQHSAFARVNELELVRNELSKRT